MGCGQMVRQPVLVRKIRGSTPCIPAKKMLLNISGIFLIHDLLALHDYPPGAEQPDGDDKRVT